MKALRHLLGALWAALWLRGRMVGLRLSPPRPAADDGHDFQLLGADVLAAEADLEAIDLPPELTARLAATRADLADCAHRVTARRVRPSRGRRRRTVALTVAAVLGLGAVGAGASALVSGTTGVPAVDRLLGIYEEGSANRPGPSGSDLQPSATKAAEPIETVLPDGSKSVTTFYVARDGKICLATATLDRHGEGVLSCELPGDVLRSMRDGGYVSGIESLGTSVVVLRGFVRGDIVSLRGRGPSGPLAVQLGEPWTPSSTPSVESLRPFVAVASFGVPLKLDRPGQAPEVQRPSYFFDALTDDGRRLRIRP